MQPFSHEENAIIETMTIKNSFKNLFMIKLLEAQR
jgi:hypothetical protein